MRFFYNIFVGKFLIAKPYVGFTPIPRAPTSQIHMTFAFNRDPINYRITAAADEYIAVGTVGIRTEGGDGGHECQTMSDRQVVYWISVHRRKRVRYNQFNMCSKTKTNNQSVNTSFDIHTRTVIDSWFVRVSGRVESSCSYGVNVRDLCQGYLTDGP